MARGRGGPGPESSTTATNKKRKRQQVEAPPPPPPPPSVHLPDELWSKVLRELPASSRLAFALTSKQHRRVLSEAGLPLRTRPRDLRGSASEDLLLWHSSGTRAGFVRARKELLLLASRGGHLSVLQLWRSKSKQKNLFTSAIAAAAAEGGQLETLKWLRSQGCLWNAKTIWATAARSGSIDLVAYLKFEQKVPWGDFLLGVAKAGHLHVLQWARRNGCPWGKSSSLIPLHAAVRGDVAMLRWLKEAGCEFDRDTPTMSWGAARHGHLNVLQWLKANSSEEAGWNFRFDDFTCAHAAAIGSLETVQWLRSQDCPWDEHSCEAAAFGGHLEVLKWLRSEDCPWDAGVCAAAAETGHFEVLKWLRSQDPPCPWDEDTWAWASAWRESAQDDEIMNWLRDSGCPRANMIMIPMAVFGVPF